jgi:hypothetical protein
MKKFIISLFIIFAYTSVFTESLFITDGSILEGKIVRESKHSVTIKSKTGVQSTIPRSKIMRVLYNDEYKGKRFIVKMDETIVEAHIVKETRNTYI